MRTHGLRMLFATPLLAVLAAWVASFARVEVVTDDSSATPSVSAARDVTGQPTLPGGGDELFISNCTYYNNAQHTQIVGQFGYDCCNNPVAWGRKTSFKECGGCFPCIPPPR